MIFDTHVNPTVINSFNPLKAADYRWIAHAHICIYVYILAWFKTYEFIYGASPAVGCAARAREHLTRARARCASNDGRASETREQIEARCAQARPRCARACSRARARPTPACANKLSARAKKLSKSQISSPNPLLESLFARARVSEVSARAVLARLARAPVFARASRARACLCLRTSRAHVLNARAPAPRARFQQDLFHMF